MKSVTDLMTELVDDEREIARTYIKQMLNDTILDDIPIVECLSDMLIIMDEEASRSGDPYSLLYARMGHEVVMDLATEA